MSLPVRMFRYRLIHGVYRPFLGCFLREFAVTGREHIPPGAVIYAATHASMADTPLLLWAIGTRANRTAVLAARDYFFRSPHSLHGALVGAAFGAVPVDRVGFARRSLDDAVMWLRSGYSLVVYPHGMIPDGLQDAALLHRGVALLARQSGCPVVPVRIVGSDVLLPAGIHWPRRAAVSLVFSPPLQPEIGERNAMFIARLHTALFVT